jgi:cell division protease FtsH
MDGFEANSGVIVVAATNRPDVLDKALLRPGRFDRQVMINLPDRKGRKEILEVHAKNIKICDSIDFSVIARNTPGFSGADLANLLNEAALTAARVKKKMVEMTDIEEAKEKILWGRERRGYHMSEQNRRNTAFHEAGHALVGLHLEHATPLHKVTIIPRGNFLGAAMYLPSDDEVSKTKKQLQAQLAVAMGGRIAEEIVFDDVTTGASGDIVAATSLAKKMVCQYGMSEGMGLIDYSPNQDNPYASASDSTKGSQHSEETSNKIDIEVRRLVESAVATARQILTDHRNKLDLFANALIEKETMEVKEICELIGIDAATIDKERFGQDVVESNTLEESSSDENSNEEER